MTYALVIDPAATYPSEVRDALRSYGFPVFHVRDADAALTVLSTRGAPPIIVTALDPPDMDAFEMIEQVRAQFSVEQTKIIAMSPHMALRTAATAQKKRLGLSAVLNRPGNAATLARAINSACGGAVARRLPRPDSNSPDDGGREPSQRFSAEELGDVELPTLAALGDVGALDRLLGTIRGTFGAAGAIALVRDAQGGVVSRSVGIDPQLASRAAIEALCMPIIEAKAPLVLIDAATQAGFSRHPFVKAGLLRGFAGVPLFLADGAVVGAIGLIDEAASRRTPADVDGLAAFGRRISGHIALALPIDHSVLPVAVGIEVPSAAKSPAPSSIEIVRQVIDGLDDSVIIFREEGARTVVVANSAAAALLRLDLSSVIGAERSAVVDALAVQSAAPDSVRAALIAPENGAFVGSAELELDAPLGRVLRWSSRPLSIAGHVFQLTTLKDLTAQVALQRELGRARRSDPLTGLLNRNGAAELFDREIARALRAASDLFVAVFAVHGRDGLPGVDHDVALAAFAMRQTIRDVDVLARWEGNLFLVLLVDTDEEEANALAKRVERAVADLSDGKLLLQSGVAPLGVTYALDQAIGEAEKLATRSLATGPTPEANH